MDNWLALKKKIWIAPQYIDPVRRGRTRCIDQSLVTVLRLHSHYYFFILNRITFTTFTLSVHTTPGVLQPLKWRLLKNNADPVLVWKHWCCVSVWNSVDRHPRSLPDWVLSVIHTFCHFILLVWVLLSHCHGLLRRWIILSVPLQYVAVFAMRWLLIYVFHRLQHLILMCYFQ